jgi:hypothetical protein
MLPPLSSSLMEIDSFFRRLVISPVRGRRTILP